MNFAKCPKCLCPLVQPAPLPECPNCGLIFAKYLAAQRGEFTSSTLRVPKPGGNGDIWPRSTLFEVPQRASKAQWAGRCILLAIIAIWGLSIWAAPITDFQTAIHFTLLPFHEAGHLIFWPFGEFVRVSGGTLGQLIIPILCAVALHRYDDNFGAALATWWLATSVMDVSVYAYDAFDPVLPLVGGGTGRDRFHDFVYLFSAIGQLRHARGIGNFIHFVGTLVMLTSLAWAALMLGRERKYLDTQASTDEHL